MFLTNPKTLIWIKIYHLEDLISPFMKKELASIANDITKFWKWIYICINKVHFLFRLKLEMSFIFTHWILFIYDWWKSFLLLSISFIDRKHFFFNESFFIKYWNIWYSIRWMGIYFMLIFLKRILQIQWNGILWMYV